MDVVSAVVGGLFTVVTYLNVSHDSLKIIFLLNNMSLTVTFIYIESRMYILLIISNHIPTLPTFF